MESLLYGYYKLHRTPYPEPSTPIKISVIQGNIPQELKWDASAKTYILDRYTRLTERAARDRPDLMIWPEASSPGLLGEDDLVFENIFSLAKKIKIPLLLGSVVRENQNYFNSALLIDSRGKIAARYDKLHLVPFGEYIPLKKFLPFLQAVVPIGDMDRGREYTIFKTKAYDLRPTTSFSVLICFEDLFPELSRRFVKKGADFLINITNDAWYKKTSAAGQHFQASVFRAVENRVNLVRSANTGISAFISPSGKIISLVRDEAGESLFITGFGTQEILIPAAKKPTFYTNYGDIFIILLFIFAIYSILHLAL
jgi:apolipoprotein N-acyltransferase